MYTEKDLVCLAKRQNNTKRTYLVVNKLQAKHIPVKPTQTNKMFDALANILRESYKEETLLLVGFAETATAIGARIATVLNSYYMQTTREQEDGVQYLYFSESHSHATEQKLIRDELDQYQNQIQRIVFIEDEVTTGNTIMKIVRILKEEYPDQFQFSVASILNGMNQASMELYQQENIPVHYLVKTAHDTYPEKVKNYTGNGSYYEKKLAPVDLEYSVLSVGNSVDARHMVKGDSYQQACENLWEEIEKQWKAQSANKILVLGTEEFMYPAIHVASKIEQQGKEVYCHATTRSPIEVSKEDGYPLQERYELASFYDKTRTTFVYDLKQYDQILVITDAKEFSEESVNSLLHGIQGSGNNKITFIRWWKE